MPDNTTCWSMYPPTYPFSNLGTKSNILSLKITSPGSCFPFPNIGENAHKSSWIVLMSNKLIIKLQSNITIRKQIPGLMNSNKQPTILNLKKKCPDSRMDKTCELRYHFRCFAVDYILLFVVSWHSILVW